MPARYLLDTNILSQLIRAPRGPVTQRLARLESEEICTMHQDRGRLQAAPWRRAA
ncbi:MAG: hypothetical protein V5B35_15305 [Candidatus Accumulibacter necessarius]|jgi:predicted nucleic acid-binding protein|uniref:hypothetical protein n=1 Tax=Candidatus Accumulibacter necessarius TaxID=2954386 RepID=UPI002FC3A42A